MRVFDAEKPFDSNAVLRSIQRSLLAPNSSKMQMWEFYHVKSEDKLKVISKFCMNQSAARTAREMIIIVIPKRNINNVQHQTMRFIMRVIIINPKRIN